jgi:AraC-like DNA-binding protein
MESLNKNIHADVSGQIPNAEKMEAVCQTCRDYLETSKRYCEPDFRLWMLAYETGMNPRTVSTAINAHTGYNFFEFINRIRIAEANSNNSNKTKFQFEECGHCDLPRSFSNVRCLRRQGRR